MLTTVHVRVNDAVTGRPTPVRINLRPLGRPWDFATTSGADVGGQVCLRNGNFYFIDGTCEVERDTPGECAIDVTRGPEFRPLRQTVHLAQGQLSLRLPIKRWIDMRAQGWYSGDTQALCLDPHAALLEGAAEDLAVINILAHERVSPLDPYSFWVPNVLAFSGQVPALEKPGHLVAVNTLNYHHLLGTLGLLNCHRPVYPLVCGYLEEMSRWSLTDLCDQCHRKKTGLVVWSDPRTIGNILTNFRKEGADRLRSEVLADLILGKVDAFEVTGLDSEEPGGLADWYQLLAAGLRVPLVGGSAKDSNAVVLGGVRTYARLQEGQEFNYANWIEAVRAGRTFVTNGPLLKLCVQDQGPGAVLPLSAGETLTLRGEAKSAVPFDCLELLVNGEVVTTGQVSASQGLHAAKIDMPWTADRSAWVAARCRGKDLLPDGQLPFAQASPIYVEVAGRPFQANAAVVDSLVGRLDGVADWVRTVARFSTDHQREQLLSLITSAREQLRRGT